MTRVPEEGVPAVETGFCSADELPEASAGKDLGKYLFPYPEVRAIQKDLLDEVWNSFEEKRHLVVHAPTGLGKTAATLAPALRYALDNKKKVFFLTSRHTQHIIAIETLRAIKEVHAIDVPVVDIIGKKWMCSVPEVSTLYSSEFTEYCRKQREDNKCEFFTNTRKGNKLTAHGMLALEQLQRESPCHIERLREIADKHGVCAYELSIALAKDAQVIVADYFYIFNPRIRDLFFNRLGLTLQDCIVIVDEGHNLPERVRSLMTVQLTNRSLKRCIQEVRKIDDPEIVQILVSLQDILNDLSAGMRPGEEKTVTKESFLGRVADLGDIDEIANSLTLAAEQVRLEAKQSSLAGVAAFLDAWKGGETGYARILSHSDGPKGSLTSLSYRCLDPSTVTNEIISNTHSTILMSGTLTPTSMFRDILGFPNHTVEKEYKSPFPKTNRLNLVVPMTTTKFAARNDQQYVNIARILADMTNLVPGNSALFFPSYYLRDQVYKHLASLAEKTVFLERPDMTKEDKMEFLENFKLYQKTGAVLLAVVSGSFGEGIDFPGDLLKCVIVVGLPLQVPNLETKKLIEYYDMKFGKGWDYGYVVPAFTKCLQSAGRCIRSEHDRGMIIFLDERYAWRNYQQYFPSDLDIRISKQYGDFVEEFFGF
ncbi:TPA: ATP-dependent DNA helicase [Candidatus Woesearchaeota archaeon]|nr:ATP-dependent DNA helicase [Candidatus Woesearchaeota archaeon]